MTIRTRFAPSPTGMLHLGGLRTAAVNFLMARSSPGGRMVLRIDDTDEMRTVPGAVDNIIKDLTWSGIDFDEGPTKPSERGPFFQSQRFIHYHQCAEKLLESGAAYKCTCSPERLFALREQAKKKFLPYSYDGKCRNSRSDAIVTGPYVVRFRLNKSMSEETPSDPILLKSDRKPTYYLASPVDDHMMDISHVIRGFEWKSNATVYEQFFAALGWSEPNVFHLPLIFSPSGEKISKRSQNPQSDFSISRFRNSGYLQSALFQYSATIGTSLISLNKTLSHEDLCKYNLLEENSKKPCFVNMDHLNHIQKMHFSDLVTKLDKKVVCDLREAINTLENEFYIPEYRKSNQYLQKVLSLLASRFSNVHTIAKEARYFWIDPPLDSMQQDPIQDAVITCFLSESLRSLKNHEESTEAISTVLSNVSKNLQSKGIGHKKTVSTLRKLITGCEVGAELDLTIELLGLHEVVVPRLERFTHLSSKS